MEDPNVLIASVQELPYLGIFILFLLANTAIPIPEEIFIVILGYIGGLGLTNLFIAVPLALTGFLLSDIIIFSLVRSDNKYITKLRDKLLSGILSGDVPLLRRHIIKIIFFSRFLVGVRFIGPWLAGTLKVPVKTFIFYDLLALLIYVPLLTFLGFYFQDRISAIINNVGEVRHYLFLISLVVLFFLFSNTIRRSLFKLFSQVRHNSKV